MLQGAGGNGLAGLVNPRSRLWVEGQAPGVEAYLGPVECSPTLDRSPLRKLEDVHDRGGDLHVFSVPDRPQARRHVIGDVTCAVSTRLCRRRVSLTVSLKMGGTG